MNTDLQRRWPGKSADAAGVAHAAVLHMLDVAAVAELLIPPMDACVHQALLLTALHDLGKVGAAFRDMLTTGQAQDHGRHWEVTEAYLRHFDPVLAPVLGADSWTRRELYAATAGHHGRPPIRDLPVSRGQPAGDFRKMLDAASPDGLADAQTVLRCFMQIWPHASLGDLTETGAQALSWQLAGLVTAADWIGSNPDWFPPTAAAPDLPAYLDASRERARHAVHQAGLDTPPTTSTPLYDFTLRPMQQACTHIALPASPMIALIEDETGAGKTEAAMILAHRMLQVGKARGLFFALPTMATADAMFARVATHLRRLYDGPASLVLAHGRAGLHDGFRDLRDARALNPDDPGPTEWLSDNRRRALMADVGVGTVDQALLGAVKAKHAALRQFGLASKVLIVDEAHEMGDPYMGALLEQLLFTQGAQGGSAILLSATLDMGLRQRLISAFERGAGRAPPALPDPAYPALTLPRAVVPALAPRPSPRGAVSVQRLDGLDPSLRLLADAAAKGASCLLIRNAVDEAIAAHHALSAMNVPTDLLHARFALCDRKRHEGYALSVHGRDRAAHVGRVLVATQVVESSLDLDFDVMVSDLAPMASLVQRAGRLWRHMDRRPPGSRPVNAPQLHVIAPDPHMVNGTEWASAVLGKGAHVYPVALLWRTAVALFKTGEIHAPDGLRALIEAAHGDGLAVPDVLERAELETEGKAAAARTLAGQNRIDWSAGYRAGASGAVDTDYPTRLGRPQKRLVLMRHGAPWSGGAWSIDSCQLSEVSAALSRFSNLIMPDLPVPQGLPDWIAQDRTFVAVGSDGVICMGLRYDPDLGLVFDRPSGTRSRNIS